MTDERDDCWCGLPEFQGGWDGQCKRHAPPSIEELQSKIAALTAELEGMEGIAKSYQGQITQLMNKLERIYEEANRGPRLYVSKEWLDWLNGQTEAQGGADTAPVVRDAGELGAAESAPGRSQEGSEGELDEQCTKDTG